MGEMKSKRICAGRLSHFPPAAGSNPGLLSPAGPRGTNKILSERERERERTSVCGVCVCEGERGE